VIKSARNVRKEKMNEIEVKLDTSKFGNTTGPGGKLYNFYRLHKDGGREFITQRKCKGDVLYAVSPDQYKSWRGHHVISELVEE